ncbi:HlyC/CorC family transporter [Sanguibacter hominis ATCC BAA-789]|uniref:HlyC/CorC family transporter n=1 Tax=Sanguibacter hominis ATCC BAA-789 TaxID=1312740 RepID=A0A9X5FAW7_9MICO|nr:hemolysin family protein [Sanguibacter hominis]NKX93071.1 HlyC/CorC family transporter [Sanguibacter hominis ATCC BAA-789]
MSEVPVPALLVGATLGIVLAALLSSGEVAVQRVTRSSMAEVAENGTKAGRRAAALVVDPRRTASAAAFWRIVAEMTATACITLSLEHALDVWWHVLGLAVVISSLVALVLVRLSPRSFGRRHPASVLVALGPLLLAALRLAGWTAGTSISSSEDVGEHELQEMVDRVNESEVIEEEERELIRSVFGLGSTLTREVMVPRTDMVTTPTTTLLPSVLRLFQRSGFSRVPVVGDSEDDVRGVVYFKDVVDRLHGDPVSGVVDPAEATTTVEDVMRPAHFVPESKPVDDLLRDLQESRSHMALVVDEYGGTAGLVTMEDAIEEIVGEVTDEHDPDAAEIVETGPGEYRVPARTNLWELGELLGLELEDDDVDTVAGLLAKALGRVPLLGSHAEVSGVHLVAERVEGRRKRVSTILAHRVAPPENDHSDSDQREQRASRHDRADRNDRRSDS